jgi:glycosyltransferase involved in cell wall biosynthesis
MNSGAAGFFESPDEALLFEAADDEALMNALDWALSNPNDLEAMGRAGRKRAASWLWSDFESRVLQQVQRSLNVDPN